MNRGDAESVEKNNTNMTFELEFGPLVTWTVGYLSFLGFSAFRVSRLEPFFRD